MISQTIITAAFESYLAGQIAAGEVVTLDEFVFAYIEGLDPTVPINPDEVVPAEEDIVCRQAVDKTGVVNEDAVVYSVTLGTGVGDFSFNWVGLVNHASGMLGAVTHIPPQDKYATTEDSQGNILTRSFLMGYAGAKLATQISTPAETWQIDFSARLSGIDERQRMENVDLYGAGAFFDTGFLVTSGADSTYTVAPGVGYVGGLRVALAGETHVAVTATPVKIWVDAHWAGTVASIWNTDFVLTAAPDLQDYTLNGYQHYVFAVAEISETGEVTDLRPQGTLDGGQQAGRYVLKTTKVNGHELSGDVNVTSQDIFSTQAIGIGNLSDLNTYVTPGLYFQPSIAQAQTGANYPEATAGSLEVYKAAGIIQVFRVYVGSKCYVRSFYENDWSLWATSYDTSNPPPLPPPTDLTNYFTKAESDIRYQPVGDYAVVGSSYTKAESDARYGNGITGFRMANYGDTYGDLRDSSMTIMTGIYEDNGYDNPTRHEHRQAQFEVAGAWYNVAYV